MADCGLDKTALSDPHENLERLVHCTRYLARGLKNHSSWQTKLSGDVWCDFPHVGGLVGLQELKSKRRPYAFRRRPLANRRARRGFSKFSL